MENYILVKQDELCHFGILGMKWGVRRYQNADGSLTSEGKKHREEQFNKAHAIWKQSRYNQDISDKVFDAFEIKDKTAIRQARKEITKTNKELNDISEESSKLFSELKNRKNKEYWEATSELAEYLNNGFYDKDTITLDDISNAIWMGVWEDGQQGYITACPAYAINKGPEYFNKAIDIAKRYYDKEETLRNDCRSLINGELEKIGDIQVENGTLIKNPTSLGSRIVEQMLNANEPKFSSSIDEMGIITRWKDPKGYDSMKKSVSDANEIISNFKIKDNANYGGWFFVNEAIDNLGMGSTKYSELTQSDWDKINAEIARLS